MLNDGLFVFFDGEVKTRIRKLADVEHDAKKLRDNEEEYKKFEEKLIEQIKIILNDFKKSHFQ